MNNTKSQTSQLEQLIEESLEAGSMSQSDHDRIMKEIHRDGQIDAEESKLMSHLFQATKSGLLQIVDSERESRGNSFNLDAIKQDAIERSDINRELRASDVLPPESSHNSGRDSNSIEDSTHNSAHEFPPSEEGSGSALTQTTENSDQSTPFGKLCVPRTNGPSFSAQNERLLDIALNGKAWIKTGSMVGYYGHIKFTREGIFEHGIRKTLKKAATGEGASLTKAVGQGNLYLADQGKKLSILDLQGQALVVNGNNILAFEDSIEWDISFLKQVAAMFAGGLFNVRLHGIGMVAITTHFDPIVLKVSASTPVMTDMNATVAWSAGLAPQIKTDISKQTMIGRSSGETVQMRFHGEGYVVIQPYEELPVVSEK